MNLTLSNQLMLRFGAPVFITILAMYLTTSILLMVNLPIQTEAVEVHLSTEELKNLQVRTTILAESTKHTFDHFKNDLTQLYEYAEAHFNSEFNVTSYYESMGTFSGPSASEYEDFSLWFNKYTDSGNNIPDSDFLNSITILDNAFRPVFKSNPKFDALYMGFEDSTFQQFPWSDKSSFVSYTGTCASNGAAVTGGYDPTCRPWYYQSVVNQESIVFTAPYSDASTGDVLISGSKAVVDNSGTFLGVMAFDVEMSGLAETITTAAVLDGGYAYLFDTEGNIVVHPNADASELSTVQQLELYDMPASFYEGIIDCAADDCTGVLDFTKGNAAWYLSYAFVPGTDYIMVMTVPVSDVTAPSDEVQDTNLAILVGSVVALSVATVVMLAVLMYVAVKVSESITSPIEQFNVVTSEITSNHVDVEMGVTDTAGQSTEMKEISQYFGHLIKAVRFGNADFNNNNVQAAYSNFCEVEKLLQQIGNTRGMGVVFNNKGNSLQRLDLPDHMGMAKINLEKAVENARELLAAADANNDHEARFMFRIVLGNRLMNLGLFFANDGDANNAIACYKESVSMHKTADNALGETKTLGSMGKLYMDVTDYKTAYGYFEEAYNTSVARYKEQPTLKNCEVLQVAAMNFGVYYFQTDHYLEARQFLNYALSVSPNMQTNVERVCLFHLAKVSRATGDNTTADAIEKELRGRAKPRNVTFVLDCSGSMAGSKINQCRTSIVDIVENFMNANDYMSLLKFDRRASWVFRGLNVGENGTGIKLKVMKDTRVGATTLFYDSVAMGVDDVLQSDIPNSDAWVIALTDGADNESQRFKDDKSRQRINPIVDFIGRSGVNLIVITVGSEANSPTIPQMVAAAEKGQHVHVDSRQGVNGIAEAFQAAMQMVNENQVNMESL